MEKAVLEELEEAEEGDARKGQQACDEQKNAEDLKKAEDDKRAREEKEATDEKKAEEEKEADEKKTAEAMRPFAEEFDKAWAEEPEKAKEGDAGKGQQACDEDKKNAEFLKKA